MSYITPTPTYWIFHRAPVRCPECRDKNPACIARADNPDVGLTAVYICRKCGRQWIEIRHPMSIRKRLIFGTVKVIHLGLAFLSRFTPDEDSPWKYK